MIISRKTPWFSTTYSKVIIGSKFVRFFIEGAHEDAHLSIFVFVLHLLNLQAQPFEGAQTSAHRVGVGCKMNATPCVRRFEHLRRVFECNTFNFNDVHEGAHCI